MRYAIRAEDRQGVRLLFLGLFIAFMPVLATLLGELLGIYPWFRGLGVIGLPLVPATYLYVAFRYQLGQMELRANRLIAFYLFVVLLLIGLPIALFLLGQLAWATEHATLTTVLLAIVTGLMAALGFPHFQRFVEHRLLGITLPPESLLRTYTERITTTLNVKALVALLQEEVLHSLLVRSSALYRIDGGNLMTVYEAQVEEAARLHMADLPRLRTVAGRYRIPGVDDALPPRYDWVRLVLLLTLEDETVGVWLLGHRDPDDYYAPAEIGVLRSLAQQTAIALTNIVHTERLRLLYEANVDRHELERTQLALALHDEVLNRQAELLWQLPANVITPEVENLHHRLTGSIRQIISALRPATLAYGLGTALEELAESLAARDGAIPIHFSIQDDGATYEAKVEQHIFRIVQQALANALRHSRASAIHLTGSLAANRIELCVEDNGVGFDASLDFNRLLAECHYGLVGMRERASLAEADLHLRSAPGQGTQVRVVWEKLPVSLQTQ